MNEILRNVIKVNNTVEWILRGFIIFQFWKWKRIFSENLAQNVNGILCLQLFDFFIPAFPQFLFSTIGSQKNGEVLETGEVITREWKEMTSEMVV